MKTRITLLLIIIPLGIVLLTLIGYTYSYIKNATSQGNPNEINTFSCLDLSLINISGSSPINIQDAYPISDEEGLKTTPYEFTVTNNCNNVTYVEVNLESLDTANNISASYIKVAVDHSGVMAPIPKILGEQPSKTATIEGAASNNIDTVYLAEGESRTYSLQIWLDEATTKAQAFDKTYEAKVVAVANPTDKYIANIDYTNLSDTTLLYHIREDNQNNFKAPLTKPGRAISLSTEALISSSPDDYGTSFYYRGAVENNYVQFAGMCWRIVRITGDGSIKLVLYNYNSDNCAQTGNALAFARVNGTSYKSAFNTSNAYNAYVGYMYGTPGSTTYAAEQENKNDSIILGRLKTWYDSMFNDSQKELLADVIWCNDKSTSDVGYGTTNPDYAGYIRLHATNATPTLICPNDKIGGKLSKFTAQDTTNGNGMLKTKQQDESYKYYKIGLMTADEVAFAGSKWSTTNSTYYLKQNTKVNDNWWTMTPLGRTYSIILLNSNSALHSYQAEAYKNNAVRPSIALKSDVTFLGGDGTASNPYSIEES